ncbi:MAG: DUF411 domain-containing protein [Hyphomicrobiaceae bacterium]
MQRIIWILWLSVLLLGPAYGEPIAIDVRKTATCGCCQAWVDRLKAAGFEVTTENMFMGSLMKFKLDHGISAKHASCHTGRIGDYTIEGHVPVREINKLLKERPDAVGLSVPGMPIGSPGMEVGTEREAYTVLLIKRDGSSEIFATYFAKQ